MDVKNDYFLMLITNAKDSIYKIENATKEKKKVEKSIENIRKEVSSIKT